MGRYEGADRGDEMKNPLIRPLYLILSLSVEKSPEIVKIANNSGANEKA